MVNYNNSIIYKLCCKDPEITEIYVGSTTNFYRRKQQHKSSCNNSNSKKKYNLNVYKFIRDNGNWENWDMVEIEKYNCNDKKELHKQERYILEKLGASLNRYIPSRTKKEYKKENEDKIKEYQKEYEKTDKRKQYIKEYEKTDKRKQYQKEQNSKKIKCELCDKEMNKHSLNKHKKNIHNI
jgi:hypothetical protein